MVDVLGIKTNTHIRSQDFLIQYVDRLEHDIPINSGIKGVKNTSYTITSPSATKYRTKLVKGLPGEFFRARVTVGAFDLKPVGQRRYFHYKGHVNSQNNLFTIRPNSRNLGHIDNQDLLNIGSVNDIHLSLVHEGGAFALYFSQSLSLPDLLIFYKDVQGNVFKSPPISARNTNSLNLSNILVNDTTTSTLRSENIYEELQSGDTFDVVLTSDLDITQAEFEASLPGENRDALATAWSPWQNIPTNKTLSLPVLTDYNYYRIQCADRLEKDTVNPRIKVANPPSYTVSSTSATKYRTQLVKALSGEVFRAKVTVGIHNTTHKGYSTGDNNFGYIDNQDILNLGSTEDIRVFFVRRSGNVTLEFNSILPLGENYRLFYYDQHGNTFYQNIGSSSNMLGATILYSVVINDNPQRIHSTTIFSDLNEGDTFDVVITDRTVNQVQFEGSLSGGSEDALAAAWSPWKDLPANKQITLPTVTAPDYYRIQCADTFLPIPISTGVKTSSSGEYTLSSKTATKYRTSTDEGHTWSPWQDIPITKILSLPAVTAPDYYRIRCADNVVSANLIPYKPIIKVANTTSYTVSDPAANKYRTQLVNALSGEVFRAKVTVGQPISRFGTPTTKGFSDLITTGYYGNIDNKDFLNLGTTDDIKYFYLRMSSNHVHFSASVDVHPARLFYKDTHGNTFYRDTHARTTNALTFNRGVFDGTETLFSTTSLYDDLSVGDSFDFVVTTDRTVTQAQFEASLSGGTEDALSAAWSPWQDIPSNKILSLPAVTAPDYYRIQCVNRLIPDPSDTSNLVVTNPVLKVSNSAAYTISSDDATKYQTQRVDALSGEVFRAKVTVGLSGVDNSKGFSDDTSPSVGLYGNIDNKDFLNLGTTDDIQYVAIALSQNIFVIRLSVEVLNARIFYHDTHGNTFYLDEARINANSYNRVMINGRSTSLATTSIYSDLNTGDTFDIVITTDQTVTQAEFEASLTGADSDALSANWSAWQNIPIQKTLSLPKKTVTTLQMIKIPVGLLQTTSYTPSFFPNGYPTDNQVLATFEGRIQNWGDFNGINPSANNQGSWVPNQRTQTIGGVSYTVERLVVSHGSDQIRFLITSSETLDNNRINLAGYSFFFYRLDDNGQLRTRPDNTPWIEEYSVANADTTHRTFTFRWNISPSLEQSVLYVANGNTESVPIGIKVVETRTNA